MKIIYVWYYSDYNFTKLDFDDYEYLKTKLSPDINISSLFDPDDIYDDIVFNIELNKDNKVIILLTGYTNKILQILDKLEKHNYENLQFTIYYIEEEIYKFINLKEFKDYKNE